MKTPYEVAAGFAVQIRRMANGLYGQTKYTKFLESIERLPDDELKRLQAVKLCSLLRYSVENVPYYKQFKGMFKLTEDSVYDDILQFPIITRDIMAEFNEKLRVPGEPYLIELKSGGTTNRRIKVLRDKPALTDRNDEYFNKILGIFPGMTRLILNRHENHYYDKEENEIEFEFNKLTRTYLVNPTFFGEKKLKITYDILMNKKPKIIRGNSTFIYEFAKAIEDRGWKSRHVPLIEGCCTTMQPHYISTVKRVFGSEMYDTYGSTETNYVACQCEERGGMHYVPASHFIEVIDKDGNKVPDGESGELVITSLSHRAMPIIRYRIGDYGRISTEKCSCGRTFPMLERIEGRVIETIRSPIGTHMTVHEVIKVLEKLDKPVDFQAVQSCDGSVSLNLMTDFGKITDEEEEMISNSFNDILGCPMNIEIRYVTEFIKQPSGKTLRVLSSMEQ